MAHRAGLPDSSRAAAEGYYRVYDIVRDWSAQNHREMFFEDCVNGGRVIDYGIVQRTHYYSGPGRQGAVKRP